MTATLTQLLTYPIKSIAGNARQSAEVEPRGLRGDRRWMVIDANGKCVTGREHGALTQIRAELDDDRLTLHSPTHASIHVEANHHADRIAATVWGTTVHALPARSDADAWISELLDQPARLVFMDADAHRAVEPDFATPGDEVSFADGYPILLLSQAAVDALNTRLVRPVTIHNFRPNLVIDGVEAHAEDTWRRIRIGDIEFDVIKPCTRCVFTTVDPATGRRDPDNQPLRTLIGYRRTPNGVTFGQNVIPRGTGTIRVGDAVTVLA